MVGLMLAVMCATALHLGATATPAAPTPEFPVPAEPPPFTAVLATYGEPLGTLTSDTEATALFRTHLAGALDLREALPDAGRGALFPPGLDKSFRSRLAQAPIRLTADLAVWQLGTRLRSVLEGGQTELLSQIVAGSPTHRAWLLAGDVRPELKRALTLAMVLAEYPSMDATAPDPSPAYITYASFFDEKYPDLVGSDTAWLTLLDREGLEGLRSRLAEYWTTAPPDPADKEAWPARYMSDRVTPGLSAYAVAAAYTAETRAREGAWTEWQFLRTWQDQFRQWRGKTRLCGDWIWTIHNHQGHQDSKMRLSFPHPDDTVSDGARPARIVVLGDAVYLRWEFRQGFQEDSLLFSKEGTRLEGTFVNTAGAWGSISGKRIGPCKNP